MGERLWSPALLCAVLVAALTTLPLALGGKTAGDQRVFLGITMMTHDPWYYLSYIQQVRQERPAIHNFFDPNARRPLPYNIFFRALGTAARWTGRTPVEVYNVSRVLMCPVVAVALCWIACLFLDRPRWRLPAVIFMLFGTGLGWGMMLFFRIAGPRPDWPSSWLPADIWMPETHLFTSTLCFPHMMAGTVTFLVALGALYRAGREGSQAGYLAAGLAGLVTGLVHVFTVMVYLAVAVVALVRLPDPRPVRSRLLSLALCVVPALAPLVYTSLMMYPDPNNANWATAPQESPSPLHFALGLGVAVPLVLLSLRHPAANPRTAFLRVWASVQALLLYTGPMIPFERRLVEGLSVPLVLLAIDYLSGALASIAPPNRRAVLIGLFALSLPTGLTLLSDQMGFLPDDRWFFRTPSEYAGLVALADQTPPDAVILAAPDNGLVIPGLAGRRVVVGHMALSPSYKDLSEVVERFYKGQLSPKQVRLFFTQFRVSHVYWGEIESGYGAPPPAIAAMLEPVARAPGHTLYRVRSPST